MITLYNGNETSFTHNGLGILKDCISAISSRELNGQWTLTIVHPLDGNYNLIQAGQIIKALTPSGYQLFRIYKVDEDLNKITIRCNHIFYDLSQRIVKSNLGLGGTQQDVTAELLTDYATGTNLFTVSGDGAVATSIQMVIGNNVLNTLVAQEEGVVKQFNCEFDFDNYNIRVLNQVGEDNGVLISFRKNLVGLNEIIDYSTLATRLFPISSDGIILPGANPYVDSPIISSYPIVYTQTLNCDTIKLDDTNTIDDVYVDLQNECIKQFNNGVDVPYFVYKVDFVQLSKTEEYKNYTVLEDVNIGDTVIVRHEKLNKNLTSRIYAYQYDCLLEKMNNLDLGNISRSTNKSESLIAKKQIAYQIKTKMELDKKYKEIQMLNQALGNYHTEIDGVGVIHNASTLATSTNALRLGSNGVIQKSTNGGSSWVDVGNGNLSIQGDFTCNNIRVNTDMYMYDPLLIGEEIKTMDFSNNGIEEPWLYIGIASELKPKIYFGKTTKRISFIADEVFTNSATTINGYTQFGNNVYITGSCSAQSFIDRTPFYDKDALSEIDLIKGDENGEIDHETLPEFAQVLLEDGHIERDIGNMVSIITKAIQQIIKKFTDIEERIKKIETLLSATDESEDK